MNRIEIIRSARSLVKTPFRHGGRTPGRACDCPGVAVLTARGVSYPVLEPLSYGCVPDSVCLLYWMRRSFEEIEKKFRAPGDLVLMWFDRHTREPQHLGVLTDTGMVHAWEKPGVVAESSEMKHWDFRITHAFRFRGVEAWQR